MKTILLGILGTVLFCAPTVAIAQERVRLEILPGTSFATEDLADPDLGMGGGVEVNVSYRFLPQTAPYVGWDWRRFTAKTSFTGPDVDVEETGYAFSIRFEHPVGSLAAPALMVRVGATYNHIEIENAAGDIVTDSGHGSGGRPELAWPFL